MVRGAHWCLVSKTLILLRDISCLWSGVLDRRGLDFLTRDRTGAYSSLVKYRMDMPFRSTAGQFELQFVFNQIFMSGRKSTAKSILSQGLVGEGCKTGLGWII
jgi:hypothetical protein